MKILKQVDVIINYIFLCVIAISFFILIFDICLVLNNPYEYKNVHHFSETILTWKSKSVILYVLKDVVFLVGLTILFFVGYKKLIDKISTSLKYVYYFTIIVFFASLFWGYYQWYLTGLDH